MLDYIPQLTLTAGQQGGIGYPPSIVKLGKWYAVSDSRNTKPPPELQPHLINQKRWQSPYNHTPDKYYHPQGWVWRKWHTAPGLTWKQVLELFNNRRSSHV